MELKIIEVFSYIKFDNILQNTLSRKDPTEFYLHMVEYKDPRDNPSPANVIAYSARMLFHRMTNNQKEYTAALFRTRRFDLNLKEMMSKSQVAAYYNKIEFPALDELYTAENLGPDDCEKLCIAMADIEIYSQLSLDYWELSIFYLRKDLRNKMAEVAAKLYPHCIRYMFFLDFWRILPIGMKFSDIKSPQFEANIRRMNKLLEATIDGLRKISISDFNMDRYVNGALVQLNPELEPVIEQQLAKIKKMREVVAPKPQANTEEMIVYTIENNPVQNL